MILYRVLSSVDSLQRENLTCIFTVFNLTKKGEAFRFDLQERKEN